MNEGKGAGSFTALLQVLFIGLKIGHAIDWPWPVVLLPYLIATGISVLAMIIMAILYFFEVV